MNFIKKYWIWILIAIALIIFLVVRSKKQSSATKGLPGGTRESIRGSWNLGYIDNREGQIAAIAIGAPRPAMGTINKGETVVIENAGPWSGTFVVSHVWQDQAGNAGAIYIHVPGTENLPVDNNIQTYSNSGKIHLI